VIKSLIQTYQEKLSTPTSPYLLGAFRVLFALAALYSAVRFLLKGWVNELYILPQHHFHFYGFHWVHLPNHPFWVYFLFGLLILSAIGLATGRWYKLFSLAYFLLFTYFELIDKTYYLNHYYFISLMAFAFLFLPMNKALVLGYKKAESIPFIYTVLLRFLVGGVYFYAGIAKINSDWLAGEPLNTWFNAFQYLPLVGDFIGHPNTAVFSAYLAMVFDISLPFLLCFRRTRTFAYLTALVFHCLTSLMFPIGVFPLIMSLCALVFFPTALWEKRLLQLKIISKRTLLPAIIFAPKFRKSILITLLLVHFVMPWRHLLYPGNVLWHEQGFRFSWRVMLMEKNGYTELNVITEDNKTYLINNSEYLTPLQEKMMSTQPDMILEYSQIVALDFEKKGFEKFKIEADSWVSLNGRKPFRMIQNNVDLRTQQGGFATKTWITHWYDQAL
jgi:hypothetical protein